MTKIKDATGREIPDELFEGEALPNPERDKMASPEHREWRDKFIGEMKVLQQPPPAKKEDDPKTGG